MKYIRTKDGRIAKFGGQTDVGYEKGTFEVHNKAGIVASYEPIDVLKQADTIEELCEVFVKKSKETGNDYFEIGKNDFYILDRKYHKEDLKHYDYYGAIWTDKGLIYVAKMNEKGELELL